MAEAKVMGGDDIFALTRFALEASSEALARAKSASADLLDTGETRAEHEVARDHHHQSAVAHGRIATIQQNIAHNSAAARHSAAAAAHEFGRAMNDAAADDPNEDGSGMELAAMATSAALALSARAHRATLVAGGAL